MSRRNKIAMGKGKKQGSNLAPWIRRLLDTRSMDTQTSPPATIQQGTQSDPPSLVDKECQTQSTEMVQEDEKMDTETVSTISDEKMDTDSDLGSESVKSLPKYKGWSRKGGNSGKGKGGKGSSGKGGKKGSSG